MIAAMGIKERLPIPPKESVVYEDDRLYVALALYPMTDGHAVVVWKGHVPDIHALARADFEYLMDMVDVTRNALLDHYGVQKVYLLYMDEVSDVHWHLVPSRDGGGLSLLRSPECPVNTFPDAPALSSKIMSMKEQFFNVRNETR